MQPYIVAAWWLGFLYNIMHMRMQCAYMAMSSIQWVCMHSCIAVLKPLTDMLCCLLEYKINGEHNNIHTCTT